MGWQDDPVAVTTPQGSPTVSSWMNDPIVEGATSIMDKLNPVGIVKNLVKIPGQIKDAAFPKRDPRFEKTPAIHLTDVFSPDDKTIDSAGIGMKATGVDDAAYGDMLQKQLGDRFIGRTKDANGYEIMSFLDKDGKKKDAYINRPGLDAEDLDRFGAQAAASLVGGKVAGGAARSGTLTAAVRQGIGQGATSLLQDTVAGTAGSDQPIDFHRALFSSIGGAGGELANGGMARVANFFKSRSLFKNGELTTKGKDLAEKYGIDPNSLTKQYQEQFAKDVVTAENPVDAATKASMENRGLNPTTAQITKNEQDVKLERDILAGDFNTRSQDYGADLRGHMKNQRDEVIPTSIHSEAEKNFGTGDTSRTNTGEAVASGVRQKFDEAQAAADEAWNNVDITKLRPDPLDRFILKSRIKDLSNTDPKLATKLASLDPVTQSNAMSAMQLLDDVAAGKTKTTVFKNLGNKKEAVDLETIRRRLQSLRDRAYNTPGAGSDFNATNDVLDVYNGYIDDLAKKAQFGPAVELQKARDLSRELKSSFGTTGKPSDDPGGRFIKDLVEKKNTSPEAIARKLLDTPDSVAAWKKLNTIFDPNAHELKLIKATVFEELFNSAKSGALKSFKQIKSGIAEKTDKQASLYKAMFTPEEQKTISRYADDILKLEKPDVSGTVKSQMSQEFSRLRKEGMLRYFLQRRGQAATFQSKPMQSFLWQMTARSKFATPGFAINQLRNSNVIRNIKEGAIPRVKPRIVSAPVAGTIGGMIGGRQ